jgi:type II secretory pathway pseudopilin PulG
MDRTTKTTSSVDLGGEAGLHRNSDRRHTMRHHSELKALRDDERGWTLVEVMVIGVIITILATVAVTMFQNYREKARLVKCMAEIRGIQAAVMNMGDGRYIPQPGYFWERTWPDGRRHGPYFYIVDGDPNEGHGNDLDGVDETNPGASDPDEEDIKFVIFCEHDHGDLGKYVYLTDDGPPRVVHDDGDDPNFQRFIKWEFGGPGANGNSK